MNCFIHQSNGRMRVRLQSLKGNIRRSEALLSALKGLDGIKRVIPNDFTGSVVIYFDPDRQCSSVILRTFRQAGHLRNIIGFPMMRFQNR